VSPRARALAISLLVLTAACIGRRAAPAEPPPSSWRDWTVTSAEVDRLQAEGRLDAADSALSAFARKWPGTPESEQGAWWLLLRQAERAEDSASTAALVTRIDSRLSAAPAASRRGGLLTLRRAAVLAQQLRTERNLARAERDEREAAAKQRSEEIDKLKAELENVKAELERVRNRVTRRRP
jgi:hypothetical protein